MEFHGQEIVFWSPSFKQNIFRLLKVLDIAELLLSR